MLLAEYPNLEVKRQKLRVTVRHGNALACTVGWFEEDIVGMEDGFELGLN
jgi:hypothetical protein